MVVLNKLISLLKDCFNLKHFLIHLLLLLVLVDLIFITFHFFYIFSLNDFGFFFKKFNNELYSIENDAGYSEIFQYIKEFWVFLIFLFLSIKTKKSVYLIWSLLFLYLLLDDSLSLHEIFGDYLSSYFNIKSEINIRAVDFGELIISFSTGLIFIILLLITYYKSGFEAKKNSIHIFILLLLLVFFGIFVDMLHVFFHNDWKFGVIEDGGEMIVMSLITAFSFNLFYIKK